MSPNTQNEIKRLRSKRLTRINILEDGELYKLEPVGSGFRSGQKNLYTREDVIVRKTSSRYCPFKVKYKNKVMGGKETAHLIWCQR